METYAQEFMAAAERSKGLGMRLPAVQLLVRKDCVQMERVQPVLQQYLGRYTQEDVVGQAFAINVQLVPLLAAKLGLPFTLTMGWFEHDGKRPYEHGEELIARLLKHGLGAFATEGLPLHVWLTSAACEVLDVTLPTTLAEITGQGALGGGVIYLSNQTIAPEIIYHPTVVGEDFLVKIGAAI